MEDLFRISLNRLTRDIKYQLERASMRHRDLSIATAVRADVLTERLLHPLATGNWVGGRTGVSRLLDRVDHMAVLSIFVVSSLHFRVRSHTSKPVIFTLPSGDGSVPVKHQKARIVVWSRTLPRWSKYPKALMMKRKLCDSCITSE